MGSSGPAKHWHYWKWGKEFFHFTFCIVRIINCIDASPPPQAHHLNGKVVINEKPFKGSDVCSLYPQAVRGAVESVLYILSIVPSCSSLAYGWNSDVRDSRWQQAFSILPFLVYINFVDFKKYISWGDLNTSVFYPYFWVVW